MIGFIVTFIGLMCFGVVYGCLPEMTLGDNWDCGYINATTTLEDIRDCYRD